ncbi:peptidoglycan editing factor PgeF [Mariniphaga sediminis]|uniref:Purine nucleoside phosphorylase n=1 Tax=Mariniphaga sediminis TaxID=1628158 RepID=A0A399D4L4_9BACT|nr:peptidoglycan editing factor PgeF [Mariniphaga sediminis]RIH65681.1 peptidoglycan editing factor PgeF [Mariniphaga sediminis]
MRFYNMDKHLISYPIFDSFKEIKAFTTLRQTFPGNEMPRFTGNRGQGTQENRENLAGMLGITAKQLVFPRQTHTDCVARILRLPEKELQETDALVTNQPEICLCVQTADCVPVLLFDTKRKTIAAIHAGWRGTVQKIVEKAVRKLTASYKTSPSDILAVIGPSIGPEVYEVGTEVVEAALENIPNASSSLKKNVWGKFHFNLWEANRQILLDTGLSSPNIQIFGECTFHEKEKYFSARREGIETGRLVSGIMLKK